MIKWALAGLILVTLISLVAWGSYTLGYNQAFWDFEMIQKMDRPEVRPEMPVKPSPDYTGHYTLPDTSGGFFMPI